MMSNYVIVGFSENREDTEVIGPFISEQDARNWADVNGMYDPYVVVWLTDQDDPLFHGVPTKE
jgi:hypothetical protein